MCLSFHPVKPSWVVGGTFNGTYCCIYLVMSILFALQFTKSKLTMSKFIFGPVYTERQLLCCDVASDISLIKLL